MAKGSKLFRLSDEAIAILDTKPNASRFVEDLILKQGENISRGETMILNRLDELMVTPIEMAYDPIKHELQGKPVQSILETTLTPSDIRADILNLESARDGELEYCQDPTEVRRITSEYSAKIDEAWKAYHLLRGVA